MCEEGPEVQAAGIACTLKKAYGNQQGGAHMGVTPAGVGCVSLHPFPHTSFSYRFSGRFGFGCEGSDSVRGYVSGQAENWETCMEAASFAHTRNRETQGTENKNDHGRQYFTT